MSEELLAALRNIADCRETVPFGENPLDFCIDQARSCLAALPSVTVGGLGARPKAVVTTEGQDAAVVGWGGYPDWLNGTPAWPVGSPEWCTLATDKIEGLTEDLMSAVQVAYRRGAVDWTRLNYPQWFAWIASQQAPISDASQPGTDDAPCVGSAPTLPTEDAAGGWQDISTAPEGRAILVCVTHSLGDDEWQTEQWVDALIPGWDWAFYPGRIDLPFPPTHWMPLPAAPTTPASFDGDAT